MRTSTRTSTDACTADVCLCSSALGAAVTGMAVIGVHAHWCGFSGSQMHFCENVKENELGVTQFKIIQLS